MDLNEQNPYAAPLQTGSPPAMPPDVHGEEERIRRQHVSHEASLKSFGFLFYLGGIFTFAAPFIFGMLSGEFSWDFGFLDITLMAVFVAIGGFYLATGYLLRSLTPAGRVCGTILAVLLAVAQVPIGTLIFGYLLYLLWSQKSKMIFSQQYKHIIAVTPHVKSRTSPLVILILLLILLAVIVFLLVGVLGGF